MPTTDVVVLRRAIDDMLSSWDDVPNFEVRVRDDRLTMVMFGFTQHVHRTAEGTLRLLDAGHVLETAPLVRKALEFAVTTQWLHHKGDKGMAGVALSPRVMPATWRAAPRRQGGRCPTGL